MSIERSMKLDTLKSFKDIAYALDTETWAITQGNVTPPLVLGSAGCFDHGQIKGRLFSKQDVAQLFLELLDTGKIICGANIAFDLQVITKYLAKQGVDVYPKVFKAFREGRIYDIQIAEMLDAIAEACLGKDPRTSMPLTNPETGRRAGYSLAVVTDLVTGRKDAKALGAVAKSYQEYDNVPLDQLPLNAQLYPVDDARNTYESALAQVGLWPRGGAHKWGDTHCDWCGVRPTDAFVNGEYEPCRATRRSRNLHNLSHQVFTAYAMNLGGTRGFCANQDSVDIIEHEVLDGRSEREEPFVQSGIFTRNKDGSVKQNLSVLYNKVALAYGADPGNKCTTCNGTRKQISANAKLVKCPICSVLRKKQSSGVDCARCSNTGGVPDPKQLVNCLSCGATGLNLEASPSIPRTETGRVATGRDVLNESGDEELIALAAHQEDKKISTVYVPWLRLGRKPLNGHVETCPSRNDDICTCSGPFEDVPLTLRPNVLVETGRASYRGVVMLLPRKPGYWVTKHEIVAVSDDYILQDGEEVVV